MALCVGVFSSEGDEMGCVHVRVSVMCPQVCECVTACAHMCLGVRVCVEPACQTDMGTGEERVEAWREEEGGDAERGVPGRGTPGERERGGTGGRGSECDRGWGWG